MSTSCPKRHELLLLCDGELSENRAAAVRLHLRDCQGCRGEVAELDALTTLLAAPVLARVEPAAGVARLMARLEVAPQAPSVGRSIRRPVVGALAVAAAAAAFLLAARGVHRDAREGAEFAARGGSSERGVGRSVGVTLYALSEAPVAIQAGARIDAGTKLVAGYRNVGGEAYLLLFAVDAAREVHWLYPAYETPGQDPASLPLPHAPRESLMATSVLLDAPAPGPMRVVAIVSAAPLQVSAVESLHGAELEVSSLRARWPKASLVEWPVVVNDEKGGSPP